QPIPNAAGAARRRAEHAREPGPPLDARAQRGHARGRARPARIPRRRRWPVPGRPGEPRRTGGARRPLLSRRRRRAAPAAARRRPRRRSGRLGARRRLRRWEDVVSNDNTKAMQEALQSAVRRMNAGPPEASAGATDPIGLLMTILPKLMQKDDDREDLVE